MSDGRRAAVVRRMRSDFLTKLDTKHREEFIRWSLPWLPVDRELVLDDENFRVRIVIEPRRPVGRPRGMTAVPFDEFLESRATVDKKFIELNGRLPTHTERAKRMGLNYWDKMRNRPTTTYRTYEQRRELGKS